jgi:hypothetical protein
MHSYWMLNETVHIITTMPQRGKKIYIYIYTLANIYLSTLVIIGLFLLPVSLLLKNSFYDSYYGSCWKATVRCSLRTIVSEEQLIVLLCCRDRAAIYRWAYELHVLPHNTPRTADRILIKFGVEVMPLNASSNSCFPTIGNTTRRMLTVVRWEDDPPQRRHYSWCCLSVIIRTISAAICR